MKWLRLGAGRRELKELEKTTIDKRIFIQIREFYTDNWLILSLINLFVFFSIVCVCM